MQALQGGQDAFTQYMQQHPGVTGRLSKIEALPTARPRAQMWAQMQQQYGIKPTNIAPTTNPAITQPGTPPAAVTPTSPTTQDPNWYKNFISQYEVKTPDELNTESNYATGDLARLNPLATPSYQEQFGMYQDLMNRELDKQVADLTESYGARGGRYTSDLTTAANTMRRQGVQDLGVQGLTALSTLNQQRMQELGGAMNVLQGVGVSKANIAQNAANTEWQNYLMGTSPPEMMDQMLSWSSQFPAPGTIVTPK